MLDSLFRHDRSDPEFEWDPAKEQRNIHYHSIDFDAASRVFKDPDRIEYYDCVHSDEEDRYITIGCLLQIQRIVLVVYTIRRNHVIRIISARFATRHEQEVYHDHS